MIGRRLAHYEILAELGAGGMGVVYKARDTHLDRLVAIKVLPADAVANPERKQRFTQEAKAASSLNHPSIVSIYDITQADGTDFIVMELVQGKTLGELIGRKGLSLKDTLNYAIQVAGALAKAHATGIIHRDLKPSNVMVTDDGLVKILDFGLAKLTGPRGDEEVMAAAETVAGDDPLKTAVGTIVGTGAYMSPEQAEGKKVDARADIFSFGAMLYEMVTGVRTFDRPTTIRTLAAVVGEDPKAPSEVARDVPRDLERIILRCLRKDPARRFQHVGDVVVELEEVKTESGTRVAVGESIPRRSRRTPLLASLAAAMAIGGAWWLWPKSAASFPPPTVVPLTVLAGDESFPALSPDGNQVAFTWDGEDRANSDIYVQQVGAARPIRLTSDAAIDTAPAWSPDGTQIAFVRRNGDAAALYVTSAAPNAERKIADLKRISGNGESTLSWLPDGKRVAVAEFGADGRTNAIVAIPLDAGERQPITKPISEDRYYFPTLAPTGRALGYALCRAVINASCHVYVVELGPDFLPKGQARRVTEQNSQVRGMTWTPDGRSLIYASGSTISLLWRVTAAGGSPERIDLAGSHAAYPAMARQSGRLAYADLKSQYDIWKFESNGPRSFGAPQNFLYSALSELHPEFSPDGTKIVFESDQLGKEAQLWVANADGTNPAPLNVGDRGLSGSPRWSPGGKWIAFDGLTQDARGVFVVDAAGGQPRLVANPGIVPGWSRDGKWIYFSSYRTGRWEIWRVPFAGGSPVQITSDGGVYPVESPDGNTLYYTKIPEGMLFARPVSGGAGRQVLDSLANGNHPCVPVDDGIYCLCRPSGSAPLAREIRFFRFATGTHETLSRFEANGQGLTVSPDRKTILSSGIPVTGGNDLTLILNFR